MYTLVVRKKRKSQVDMQTDLTIFMERWREEHNLTVEAAAQAMGVVKSTWSNLENGKRKPDMETIFLLEDYTKVPFDELARMSRYPVRRSKSVEHRAQRVAGLAESMPSMNSLIDVLPDLKTHQVDTLLSLAEDMRRRNGGS